MSTACREPSGQGDDRESEAVRRTDTIDNETCDRAVELTIGEAHVPTGLHAPLRGLTEKRRSLDEQGGEGRETSIHQSDCWPT